MPGNAIARSSYIKHDIGMRKDTMAPIDRIERRLKLHDVRVLMAVIEAGSMAKAAQRLGTSQPAVSRSIADLEHTLGVRLLERSAWGVEPTQYGEAIVRRGVAVFDELRQGVKDIEFLSDPTAGELRIGCPEAIATGPVLAVMNRLTRRHPRIVFHVMTGNAPSIRRGLMERAIEVGIMRVMGRVDEEALRVETLFDDELLVAAGANNPLARRRRIDLAELVDEKWVMPLPDSFTTALAADAFRQRGLELPAATVITPSQSLRNQLLVTGGFLTVIHGFALAVTDKYPTIRPLPIGLASTRRPIAIFTLKKRVLSPLAESFIASIRSIAKALVKNG
jgi:DNA-binding transcriptional LysR family regulator